MDCYAPVTHPALPNGHRCVHVTCGLALREALAAVSAPVGDRSAVAAVPAAIGDRSAVAAVSAAGEGSTVIELSVSD